MKYFLSIKLIILSIIFNHSILKAQTKYKIIKKNQYPLFHSVVMKPHNKNEILRLYFKDSAQSSKNQFIGGSPRLNQKIEAFKNTDVNSYSGIESSLGTPLIDALATVITNRFKQELTTAFLDSFKEKLKEEKYLGATFPNTKNVLLNDDIFNYKSWLTSLRGGLDEDLRDLPDNFPQLLEVMKNEQKDSSSSFYKIVESIIAAYKPTINIVKNPDKSYTAITELLNNLRNTKMINDAPKIDAVVTLAYIIIKELGNTNYDEWASKNTLETLNKKSIFKNFIGFTIEKHKDILISISIPKSKNSSTKINLYDFLRDGKQTIQGLSNNIEDIIQYVKSIKNTIIQFDKFISKLNDLMVERSLNYNDYSDILLNGIQLIEKAIFKHVIVRDTVLQNKLKKFSTYATSTIEFGKNIYTNITDKEYSKIIVNVLSFLRKNTSQEKLNNSKFFQEFLKYANLAINLSGAKTSEEMVKALEQVILPPQSYRLKRNSVRSISLNSYAGIFGAREYFYNSEASTNNSYIAGLTAPIGIGFNWGFYRNNRPRKHSRFPMKTTYKYNKKGKLYETLHSHYYTDGSFSIFVSLVDVGTIVNFRLGDADTPIQDVTWKDIFAPGLYLVYGIPRTPLALSIGGQYGPQLRKIEKIGSNDPTITVDTAAWRFGISLTVDIPLLHFYTKTERIAKKHKK